MVLLSILDQPRFVAFCSCAAVIAIIVPLFFIPFGGGSVLKDALQKSEYLMFCHTCCITSAIPLAAEFFLDLYSQEIFSATQLRERFLILVTMIAFSITFIVCRKLDSIAEVYVAAHNIRFSILMTVIYYAVIPELKSKNDKIILYGFNFVAGISFLSRVLDTYTVYFSNSSSLSLTATILYGIFLASGTYSIYRWLIVIAARQKARFVQLNRLTIDEYVSISYILPYLTQSATFFWNLSTGQKFWRDRNEESLIFQICLVYFFYLIIILVPGRMLHIIAVTSRNLLKMKQIFVRFASHEIRSPLNVVHAGLDLLLGEVRSADPLSPYVPITRSTADFIVHMFTSSESAINILNDLLQYEHMEAGTFTLDLERLSLVGLLKEKFGWASLLAVQKVVTFRVEDDTLATEFGPGSAVGSIQSADVENGCAVVEEALLAQKTVCLQVDMCRIDQVMRNLITNAMKFTPSGGEVAVGISCKMFSPSDTFNIIADVDGNSVGTLRVEVTDSGAGLSEEEQNAIFGEFTQFNKNKLQGGGGSGLGLWISRRIIHIHKGSMGVTSRGRGCGSTFFFELPVFRTDDIHSAPIRSKPRPQSGSTTRRGGSERVHVSSSAATSSPSHASERPPDLPSIRFGNYSAMDLASDSEIQDGNAEYVLPLPSPPRPATPIRLLIVDDSAINCKVIAKLIESEKDGLFANAVILTADDGTTAVQTMKDEMAAGREVHFVLMDFVMLDMNGPEAAHVMREELQYRGTILGVTGNVLAEDIHHFVSNGANEVLSKPLTKGKLLSALNHYARMQSMQPLDQQPIIRYHLDT